eukprot:TRINITY_DN852_c0_g1_i1.p1 TRINITY_DN852_c0_g1~~TRINITY_DN852_c0_g1_i1.p1  ORF type:complete len:202 (-),score=36.32 TRINITY_DN852_c0_g1_i1:40-645(-)
MKAGGQPGYEPQAQAPVYAQPGPGYVQPVTYQAVPQQAVYYQPNYQSVQPQIVQYQQHHHHHDHSDDPTCTGNAALGAFLVYFFGIIGALVGICVERRSSYVVFHAYQSLYWNLLYLIILIPLRILGMLYYYNDVNLNNGIYLIVSLIDWLFTLVVIIVSILLLIMAVVWARERRLFKLPLIGQLAEKSANSREYETLIYQ